VERRTQAEASWKKKLAAEKAEQKQASKSYEEELADVKKTEAELAEAANNLRKYRRAPHVDDNGGVYNVPDDRNGVGPLYSHATVALILVWVAMTVC